jgi:hypothetical protein
MTSPICVAADLPITIRAAPRRGQEPGRWVCSSTTTVCRPVLRHVACSDRYALTSLAIETERVQLSDRHEFSFRNPRASGPVDR